MSENQIDLDIDGMSCGSCIAHVRSALEKVSGVGVDEVQVGRATVQVEPGIGVEALERAISAAGYTVRSSRRHARETSPEQQAPADH